MYLRQRICFVDLNKAKRGEGHIKKSHTTQHLKRSFDLSLYLVTDRGLLKEKNLEDTVKKAIAGGVTMVQLREKDCTTLEFYEIARKMKELLKPFNIPLIINDRVDILLAVDAEGLHIGQSDLPYETARKILGENKIIGLTVQNMEQIEEANKFDVDYIGIGPIFETKTKVTTTKPFEFKGLQLKKYCLLI